MIKTFPTIEEATRRHGQANKRHALAVAMLVLEPDLRLILVETSLKRGLTVEDVLPVTRDPGVVHAMHEFFYRALTETSASTVLIGHAAARDHSTVIYGATKWANMHSLPKPRGYTGAKFNNQRGRKKTETEGAIC